MLVKIPLIKGGWEKLYEEMQFFFNNLRTATSWSKKLFGNDFYEKVIKHNSGLEDRLKTFAHEFLKLTPDVRESICDEFALHNRVKDLCESQIDVTFNWEEKTNENFVKAAKNLFVFMYENTLNTVSYKTFCGQSLKEHYLKFREDFDLTMCPFCGLKDYGIIHPDLDWRDAYDHYLHKELYPFAAVNPENLFPMCGECNSKAKGAHNILIDAASRRRRRAFYPSVDLFEIKVLVEDGLSNPPALKITLEGDTEPERIEKFDTWLSVFKIQPRYEGTINIKRKDWLVFVLDKNGTDDIVVGDKLNEKINTLTAELDHRQQSQGQLNLSFLEYCKKNIKGILNFLKSDPKYASYIVDRTVALTTS